MSDYSPTIGLNTIQLHIQLHTQLRIQSSNLSLDYLSLLGNAETKWPAAGQRSQKTK